MRRRLLVMSIALVSILLVALMAPLIVTFAGDRTQDLFVSRLSDVTRFAVLAGDVLEGDDTDGLTADLERYAEVYGGSVLVVNANREVVASSREGMAPEGSAVGVVDQALAGSPSQPPPTAWPWHDDPVLIASPVGRDAQVLGAVLMVAPTQPVQDSVQWWLMWLVLAGLATLGLTAYGVVVPFVGWTLRPVHDLDATARRLALGEMTSRAHQTGPPELRDLARSFNLMADNVETSQRQQRDLVADAAHQLGNPLTALRLRVENLGSLGASDEAEKALEETDRLRKIVESLLDLSQVGAHAATVTAVDVAAAARHRCDMWAPMFERLDVDAPASATALATDDIVDVLLDALLDNASKFAADAPVQVTVVAEADGVLLRVRDHGPGLHPDDVQSVGARFFRGREHQNVPGTGLGLAIVHARMADIGGRMEVRLADGGGLQVDARFRRPTDAVRGSSAPRPDGGPAET